MINAVFLDLYNTIVRFDPVPEEIQAAALASHNLSVEREAIVRAYPFADDFMAQENERQPIQSRPSEERVAFFTRYEQILLHHAGLDVTDEVAASLFAEVRKTRLGYALFDDVLPTLEELKSQGKVLGILSNIDEDIDDLAEQLGLTPYLDFALSSAKVGVAKPHPTFFLQALQSSGTAAGETVHVGDQHRSDVEGARGVGIHTVLLDRDGHSNAPHDCPRIASLMELPALLEETAW